MAPPHTRGWTRRAHRGDADDGGSPAHAGMDPGSLGGFVSGAGLPRTRGDGPKLATDHAVPVKAPPHTRGWTRRSRPSARYPWGSPAHAGMDPMMAFSMRSAVGLPRTRGDGPRFRRRHHPLRGAPPHTRGWTRLPHARRLSRRGSPAHAGMDPLRRTAPQPIAWLPRTRGDGPCSARIWPLRRRAPPHTRGWTRALRHPSSPGHGSPAHAGMDPAKSIKDAERVGLPRTRGDGPLFADLVKWVIEAPPHTRGWTLVLPREGAGRRGSPAHAGMDPHKGMCI